LGFSSNIAKMGQHIFTSSLIGIEIYNVAVVILYQKHLLDHLHWRMLHDNASDSVSHYLLALATLGAVT